MNKRGVTTHALGLVLVASTLAVSWGPASAQATNGAGAAAGAGLSRPGSPATVTGSPGRSPGARYVESCQQDIERGVDNPSCQGPLYASEIARLKEDALRSNNPNLLTLLGDAYQSNRSGISDIGQAYRWYLLAAVRGDPRAMQRLSELYKNGRGAPQDNIKALGYARLAQRLAPPGSTSARKDTGTIGSLAKGMASDEVVLADRFASELEDNLRRQSPGDGVRAPTPANASASPGSANEPLSARLPGIAAAQTHNAAPARGPAAAGASLPGSAVLSPAPPRQP